MNAVAAMLEIYSELQSVAEAAAKRLPEIARACEVTLADCDEYHYQMAIYAAICNDKVSIQRTMKEIERLTRNAVQEKK